MTRRHFQALCLLTLLLALVAPTAGGAEAPEAALLRQAPVGDQPPATLQAVVERLRAVSVMRAEFRQVKQVTGLTRPLVSRGRLLFAAGRGLVWETRQPFPSLTVITPVALHLRQEDGSWRRLNNADQPLAKVMGDLFMGAFAGDLEPLRGHFELRFQGAPEAWTLALTPREPQMRKLLSYMLLAGGAGVERVLLVESNGDRTELELQPDAAPVPPLSPAEEAHFALP